MALIDCKDCKKQFSTDAKKCPHCGAKPLTQGNGCLGWSLVIFSGFVFFVAIQPGGNIQQQTQHPEDYVLSYCRDFTKDSLHDRSNVEFDRDYPKPTAMGGNKYGMTISLRARNGFGAMRHFSVDCVVRFNGDTWSLVSLKETR